MKTLCGRIKHIVSLTQHQLHICFLDIFYSGFMDWGGLDLRDRGFWIRDILDIIVSGCMDLGRSGSSGQELLETVICLVASPEGSKSSLPVKFFHQIPDFTARYFFN